MFLQNTQIYIVQERRLKRQYEMKGVRACVCMSNEFANSVTVLKKKTLKLECITVRYYFL